MCGDGPDTGYGEQRAIDENLTDEDKIKAMVDYFGYTHVEARQMLQDAGQIDPMEMSD